MPQDSSRSTWIEHLALGILCIVGIGAVVSLICVFWSRLSADPHVDIVREVRVDYTDYSRTVELRRDTVITIAPNEYSRILTEVREQNRFLNDLVTIVVTSLTLMGGITAVFAWRLRQKYEQYANHQKTLQDDYEKYCMESKKIFDTLVIALQQRSEQAEKWYQDITRIQGEYQEAIATGNITLTTFEHYSKRLEKARISLESEISEAATMVKTLDRAVRDFPHQKEHLKSSYFMSKTNVGHLYSDDAGSQKRYNFFFEDPSAGPAKDSSNSKDEGDDAGVPPSETPRKGE